MTEILVLIAIAAGILGPFVVEVVHRRATTPGAQDSPKPPSPATPQFAAGTETTNEIMVATDLDRPDFGSVGSRTRDPSTVAESLLDQETKFGQFYEQRLRSDVPPIENEPIDEGAQVVAIAERILWDNKVNDDKRRER